MNQTKFFRSLVIVLPLAALLSALHIESLSLARGLIAGSLALAWLSFLRYAERRHKSTQWAFYYVLVLCRGDAAP